MNPLKWMMNAFTVVSVFLYRSTGGLLGGRIRGFNVLLLTTTGRKTGRQRTTPLGYLREGDSYVIIASNAGQKRNPGWYFNLQQNPLVQVQIGGRVLNARALTAQGDQRRQLWSRVVAEMPGYANYQKHTQREIPLVVLTPVEK
ncbi:MAG TPA: nitroreductase family deazaflavin-dependent oxidoreductase [Anaerolineales bacterium]